MILSSSIGRLQVTPGHVGWDLYYLQVGVVLIGIGERGVLW